MLVLAGTAPAYAYVDPGGATIILQILAAVGAAGFLMIRRAREFVTGLFTRQKDTDASSQDKAE